MKDILHEIGIPNDFLICYIIVICITIGCLVIIKKKRCICVFLYYLLLAEFLTLIFSSTLFFRSKHSEHEFRPDVFDGYVECFRKEVVPYENILNIVLFLPVGYIICCLTRKYRFFITLCLGLTLSLFIESMQYVTRLGIFDLSDLLNNTLGTIFGYIFFMISRRNCK